VLDDESSVLAAAAWLHDIGYAPELAVTGVSRRGTHKLQQKGLAETHRRVIFANASAILTAAVEDERIRNNPCNGRSVIKPRGEYPKVVPWDVDRVHAVRQALGQRYRAGLDLGAGCGLRQGARPAPSRPSGIKTACTRPDHWASCRLRWPGGTSTQTS